MGLTFDKNTYFAEPKSDAKDKIQVEIGDSKQENFYPQVKIMRWDNEVNFSARLVHDEKTPIVTTLSDKVIWEGEKTATHFYEIQNEEHPEGASEFEVILKEKPLSNKVEFTINTKGLDFFYQPELTQAEIDDGVIRPENVVGSYAVYYKNCPANYVGGKEYKAGKFCHIYRPQIIDANNNKIWGELSLDEQKGMLTITIPQDFLDKAVYPVLVDPTFGYTTQGTAGSTNFEAIIVGSVFSASEAGTVTQIDATIQTGPEVHAGLVGIYDTGYNLITNGGSIAVTSLQAAKGWQSFTFSSNPSITATNYVLIIHGNSVGFSTAVIYYDAGSANQGLTDSNAYTGSALSSFASPTLNNNKYSIYATYTASGGSTIWTTALV